MDRSHRNALVLFLHTFAFALTLASGLPSAFALPMQPIDWLASHTHGAPCREGVDECAYSWGLSCISGKCVYSGDEGEACRPSDDPLGEGCNAGLACASILCVPAGGKNQPCLPCSTAACVIANNRCNYGLACDIDSDRCVTSGGSGQPCREGDVDLSTGKVLPQCDSGLVCSGGSCVTPGVNGAPCNTDDSCGRGLFCQMSGSSAGKCLSNPQGLTSFTTTQTATACVDNVPAAFKALKTASYTDFSFNPHEGGTLPPSGYHIPDFDWHVDTDQVITNILTPWKWSNDLGWENHLQSIVQLPGSPERFLISRNVYHSDDPAGLMVADRSQGLFMYAEDSQHPGGMSTFGYDIAVANEHAELTPTTLIKWCTTGQQPTKDGFGTYAAGLLKLSPEICHYQYFDGDPYETGFIDFWHYDPSKPSNPLTQTGRYWSDVLGDDGKRPSSVAFTRIPDGRRMILFLGRKSEQGWLLLEDTSGKFKLLQHMNLSSTHTEWQEYQNTFFVTDCSGTLYVIASAGDWGPNGHNSIDLWKLVKNNGTFDLEGPIDHWRADYDVHRCQAYFGADPIVTANGKLQYVCATGLSRISNGNNLGVRMFRP